MCLAAGAGLALHSGAAFPAKSHQARGKSSSAEKRRVQLPADVWVRVRHGLALSRPSPVVLPPPPEPPHPVEAPAVTAAAERPAPAPRPLDLRWTPELQAHSPWKPNAGLTTELAPRTESPVPAAPGGEAVPAEAPKTPEETQREYEAALEKYEELKKRAEIYDRFAAQVEWYRQRSGFVQQSLERARPYIYLIIEELEKQKLPLDLALLPIVESGYKARAESNKEASGIWQFIPSTGKSFGLLRNEGYDGRFDIAESTRAAASYLAHLRNRFHGDWLLALASYNCGEGRVEQAIAANRAAGLPTDFWSLTLPEETRDYVPRLLALSEMFSNPGAYRLKPQPAPNQPLLERITFSHILPVEKIATLANLTQDEFLALNPGFTGGMIGLDATHDLLLPRRNAALFARNLQLLLHPPEPTAPVFELTGNLPGYVHTGFQVAAAPLKGVGHTHAGTLPPPRGEPLVISSEGSVVMGAAKNLPNPEQGKKVASKLPPEETIYIHAVTAGETVEKIAEYYDVNPESIRAANKLKGQKRLEPGKNLVIPFERVSSLDSASRPALPANRPPPGAPSLNPSFVSKNDPQC
jgi:membrane-bound lytic murein transglycosylase D